MNFALKQTTRELKNKTIVKLTEPLCIEALVFNPTNKWFSFATHSLFTIFVLLFPCFDNEKRRASLAKECERTHVCLASAECGNNFVSPVGVRERAKSKLSKHFQGRNGPTPTVNHAPATAARLPEVCRCDSGCYVSAAVRHYLLLPIPLTRPARRGCIAASRCTHGQKEDTRRRATTPSITVHWKCVNKKTARRFFHHSSRSRKWTTDVCIALIEQPNQPRTLYFHAI